MADMKYYVRYYCPCGAKMDTPCTAELTAFEYDVMLNAREVWFKEHRSCCIKPKPIFSFSFTVGTLLLVTLAVATVIAMALS